MQPMIIVCPTCNNTSGEDSGNCSIALQLTDRYHNELVNDLMPAVESRYSTWAEATTPEGLRASRDHRGFGGFSMGSVTTWHTFQDCLDYFRYFMPMSGNMGGGGGAGIRPDAGGLLHLHRYRHGGLRGRGVHHADWPTTSGTSTCPSASGRAAPTAAWTPWMTALPGCAGSGKGTDGCPAARHPPCKKRCPCQLQGQRFLRWWGRGMYAGVICGRARPGRPARHWPASFLRCAGCRSAG